MRLSLAAASSIDCSGTLADGMLGNLFWFSLLVWLTCPVAILPGLPDYNCKSVRTNQAPILEVYSAFFRLEASACFSSGSRSQRLTMM